MKLIKAPGYMASDGTWFAKLEDAQAKQIALILNTDGSEAILALAAKLVACKEQVVEVLVMKQRGRPRTVKPVKQARKAKHPPFVSQFEGDRNNEEETPHVRACKV